MKKKKIDKEKLLKVFAVIFTALFFLSSFAIIATCFQFDTSAASSCSHQWTGGYCPVCGAHCEHPSFSGGKCTVCNYGCAHNNWASGKCLVCNYSCKHEAGFTSVYPPKCIECNWECSHKDNRPYYVEVDGNSHKKICDICNTSMGVVSHTFVGNMTECDDCGYTCKHPSWASGECLVCGYTCSHSGGYTTAHPRTCLTCGLACSHPSYSNGKCSKCGEGCTHPSYTSGKCSTCGKTCSHSYSSSTGKCTTCGITCSHSYSSSTGKCTTCGKACSHSYNSSTGICSKCKFTCKHANWSSGKCLACGYTCSHSGGYTTAHPRTCLTCGLACSHPSYSNGKCSKCGEGCTHPSYTSGKCSTCGAACSHNFVDGLCTRCNYDCPHPANYRTYSHNYVGEYESIINDPTYHVVGCTQCNLAYVEIGFHEVTVDAKHVTACKLCGYTCFEGYNVSNKIVYFSSFNEINRWSNTSQTTEKNLVFSYDGEFPYVRSAADSKTASLQFPTYNGAFGKYLFIKYRIPSSSSANVKLNVILNGSQNNMGTLTVGTSSDGWTVVCLDISYLNGYKSSGGSAKFEFHNKSAVDIAYVAMSDSLSALRGLLSSKETYFSRGMNFADTTNQVEFDSSGKRLSSCGHAAASFSISEIEGNDIVHSAICHYCSEEVSSKVYHNYNSSFVCSDCGHICAHGSGYKDGLCKNCGFEHPHSFKYGYCSCGYYCPHNNVDNFTCTSCGTRIDVGGIDVEDGFLKLFTAIYDAQANTFFSLLGYDILGVNIATLIISVVALAIIGFILKKVI